MAIARQWLSTHAHMATDMHATMEELLDTVFSMQSVPRLYNKDETKMGTQQLVRGWS
jgi:hypothetical protein